MNRSLRSGSSWASEWQDGSSPVRRLFMAQLNRYVSDIGQCRRGKRTIVTICKVVVLDVFVRQKQAAKCGIGIDAQIIDVVES